LGKLRKVELRDVWKNEAEDFTPWLAQEENLKLLGEALGMELELKGTEEWVGPFRADIFCRDARRDILVLVENQLERTDHSHLGQILTYAAGLDTAAIIWVAANFTPEHRAALDWLNRATDENFSFFGLEIELWQIGDSPVAPKFNIVCQPDSWSRDVRSAARRSGLTEHQRLQQEYWTQYLEFMVESKIPCGPARPKNTLDHPTGDRSVLVSSVASMFRQGATGKVPELRAEFGVWMDDPGPTFAWFEERKEAIETSLGASLVWDKEKYTRYYRAYLSKDADMREREQWDEQHKWLREHVEKMYDVFAPLAKECEALET
jgi:hypothetical protein